jgi:ectoine hydroxylase
MKLTPTQLKEFDEQGYLFFPNCFDEEEIALLRDDAEAILKLDRKRSLARENRRTTHRLCRAHFQRDVPADGESSPAGRAAAAIA